MFLRALSTICARTVFARHCAPIATKCNTNLAALYPRFSTYRGFSDDDEYPKEDRRNSQRNFSRPQFNRNRDSSNNFNKTVQEKPDWKPFEKNFYKPLDIIHPKEDIDNFIKKHKITINGPAPAPVLSFDEVCFPDYIQNKLTGKDFTTPTPIQSQCWPIALSGQNLVGVAQTGSGKTLGYILPAIVHIKNQEELKRGDGPIALVLAPTRELAQQIQQVVNEYGKPCNVRNACVFGGAGKGPQADALYQGSEIVIATPGRLIDFLDSGVTNLNRCTYLVLDEADLAVLLEAKQEVPDELMEMSSRGGPVGSNKRFGGNFGNQSFNRGGGYNNFQRRDGGGGYNNFQRRDGGRWIQQLPEKR
ncbi:hypothetical protein HA402_008350 [Bradysia odoriphaga]|nr:hypothetical protein HA402_008350 [Bradysia odoriphaga]